MTSKWISPTLTVPAVGGKCAAGREAHLLGLHRQHVDPEFVVLVRAFDGQVQAFGQLGDHPDMIKMAVGHQQLFQRDTFGLDGSEQLLGFAAGINQRAAHAVLVPDQAAILLKRSNRKYFDAK